MANAMQYIANLGKSVIYSGVDQIKANNPAIAELAEQNAELGKVLYQSVTDFKSTQVKISGLEIRRLEKPLLKVKRLYLKI